MAWSAITSVVTYSAGNAVPIPHAASEPIKVRLRHPGTGSDGIVTLYGSAGEVIQTATVSAANPISEIEFRTSSQTINYSTDRAFDAPGLTIEPMGVPMFKTDGQSVQFTQPVVAPNTVSQRGVAVWTMGPIGSISNSSTVQNVGQLVVRAPCEFSRIRVWAANNTASPVNSITKILAAVSSGFDNATWNPSVGSALTEDQTTGWITGDADGITVPANSTAVDARDVPSYAASSIINISSIPAADGGRPWLFLRHTQAATGTGYIWLEGADHAYNPDDLTGSYCRYRRVTNTDYSYCGASATSGGAALAAGSDSNLTPLVRIDFWSKANGWVTFDAVGGSTFEVTNGTVGYTALQFMRVANKAMLANKASVMSYGVSGATSKHYAAMAAKAVANTDSKYLLYAVFTQNDGGFTQALTDQMMRRFYATRDLCRDAGKICVAVVTLHDTVGNSPSLSAIRDAAKDELRANGPVIDLGDCMGTETNRNKFISAYTVDGTHFSDAGRDAAAAWLPGALKNIVYQYPAW